ncbi:uncharacterized protein LOC113202680 [Frankliniella occidentalis]|uniref:Uncharacterized protein LOC113202680 n=1 Tax=Frankliniella occidentalis TaxID=133901 RepID=A0A6J1S0X5_FRAOC|nr:uncharacterized protein LOC113202680 [Frankliniella occidentalis]
MKLLVALTALFVAALLAPGGAGAASTYQQSAKATLDFINQEQAHGAAEASAPKATAAPRPASTTPTSALRRPGDSQQHVVPLHPPSRQNATSTAPKKDWELVTPRQAVITTPRTAPTYRPVTPPSYAGVVKDHGHGHGYNHQDRLPTLPATTTRPRVYNIPIVVEDRGNYTTTTEQSRWYDKLFGKGTDLDDDSPWGRRKRQASEKPEGAERSEVVIGSNAITVSGGRKRQGAAQSRPRPQPNN